MIKKLILKCILISISVLGFGQFDNYQSFEQLDSLSQVYFQTNKLDSAVLAIEYALEKYPQHDKKATYILGFLYVRTGNNAKALEIWKYGHTKEYFYGLNNRTFSNHFRENEEFNIIAGTDLKIGNKLDSISHIEYELVMPKDYSDDKEYPVIFIFHGNGRNLQKAKQTWTSEVLTNDFIVVYLQSYIHSNPFDFRWTIGDNKTDKELRKIYDDIIQLNSTDNNKILFAGMSAGGMIALDYAFSKNLPYSSLLLNCPVVPNIEDESIHTFASSNKKIVIISGEKDFALENQKELISKINDLKGQAEIKIITGMEHDFPKDFSSLLDKYLKVLND